MRKNILKILFLIIIYVSISLAVYFVLKLCGLNSVNNIRKFVSSTGGWAYLVFFLFQVVVSTFVCIIPLEDELLTMSAIVLFGPMRGFLIASFNMFVTSMLQFIIGRYFCGSMISKLIGDDSVIKYQKCMEVKGVIMLPILYAIPLFPHDSLCILAGMTKMKAWYFALVTFIMRSAEIASVCFLGSGIIDFSSFSIVDWILVINILIIDIYLIFKLQKYIENKANKNNGN